MAGLLGYASDSDSDSDVGLGAISSMPGAQQASGASPAVPISAPAPQPEVGDDALQGPALPPPRPDSPPLVPEVRGPDPVLQKRIEHFAELTMAGNDLVKSLKSRLPAVQAPHNEGSMTVAEYGSTHPDAGVASAFAGPTFATLEEAADREAAELERLRAAFPHLRAPTPMHG